MTLEVGYTGVFKIVPIICKKLNQDRTWIGNVR